jgi:hypothetical protein
MLDRLDPKLAQRHGRLVELSALRRTTLELLLDPGVDIGPDRLEAEIAAPDTADQRGRHGEQDGEEQQQQRQHPEVLR